MTVPLDFVEANQYHPQPREIHPQRASGGGSVGGGRSAGGETAWERVKKSISVYAFVSQFVDLKRSGSGYVGHCPFHDDRRPSFSVNSQKNYWQCFAGCGGGSIIDFWMIREGINFSTALMELEAMVLHHPA